MSILRARPRAGILLLAGVGVLWLAGCHKKKASAVPPQAQAPTLAQPAPAPPAVPTNSTHPEIKPATPPPTPATPPRSKNHHPARKPAAPAPATPPAAADVPAKTTVPEGSAPSTSSQLTPSLTPEEAERTRQSTVQLLAATEANLQNLAQPLSREEQATVDEIRSYLAQARAALAEGDLLRAYNLAGKAHLLSNALPKK
ncbi:MAG TPA: hypothetical protein VEG08_05275 [Terriglobales bacterium]|nr:hypothetical protein [Terriglobales bacterium]